MPPIFVFSRNMPYRSPAPKWAENSKRARNSSQSINQTKTKRRKERMPASESGRSDMGYQPGRAHTGISHPSRNKPDAKTATVNDGKGGGLVGETRHNQAVAVTAGQDRHQGHRFGSKERAYTHRPTGRHTHRPCTGLDRMCDYGGKQTQTQCARRSVTRACEKSAIDKKKKKKNITTRISVCFVSIRENKLLHTDCFV